MGTKAEAGGWSIRNRRGLISKDKYENLLIALQGCGSLQRLKTMDERV